MSQYNKQGMSQITNLTALVLLYPIEHSDLIMGTVLHTVQNIVLSGIEYKLNTHELIQDLNTCKCLPGVKRNKILDCRCCCVSKNKEITDLYILIIISIINDDIETMIKIINAFQHTSMAIYHVIHYLISSEVFKSDYPLSIRTMDSKTIEGFPEHIQTYLRIVFRSSRRLLDFNVQDIICTLYLAIYTNDLDLVECILQQCSGFVEDLIEYMINNIIPLYLKMGVEMLNLLKKYIINENNALQFLIIIHFDKERGDLIISGVGIEEYKQVEIKTLQGYYKLYGVYCDNYHNGSEARKIYISIYLTFIHNTYGYSKLSELSERYLTSRRIIALFKNDNHMLNDCYERGYHYKDWMVTFNRTEGKIQLLALKFMLYIDFTATLKHLTEWYDRVPLKTLMYTITVVSEMCFVIDKPVLDTTLYNFINFMHKVKILDDYNNEYFRHNDIIDIINSHITFDGYVELRRSPCILGRYYHAVMVIRQQLVLKVSTWCDDKKKITGILNDTLLIPDLNNIVVSYISSEILVVSDNMIELLHKKVLEFNNNDSDSD